LQLECDEALSNVAFKFDVQRYTTGIARDPAAGAIEVEHETMLSTCFNGRAPAAAHFTSLLPLLCLCLTFIHSH
jgi:hypothetical protein